MIQDKTRKQTLAEALSELSDDTLTYVGSKSGFFWIGYPPDAEEQLRSVSTRSYVNLLKRKDTLANNLLTEVNPKKINKVKSMIRENEKNIKGWKPILQRVVKDIYPHTSSYPGITILVSGNEVGKYWMYEEVLKRKAILEESAHDL